MQRTTPKEAQAELLHINIYQVRSSKQGFKSTFFEAQSKTPQHKDCLDWQKLFWSGTINAAFPEILFEDNV